MSKKLFNMYHKIEKNTDGYAKKIRDCSYTEEEFQSIYGGDYKKMFPKWGNLPEYDFETHCIYYGEGLSYPTVDNGIVREMNTAEKFEAGLIPLGEGEVYQNGEIVNIDKPSNYHTWDNGNKVYILTPEKEIEWKEVLKSQLKDKREEMLEQGTIFEEKIIKGRTQDVSDARGQLDKVVKGKSAFWAYSSGQLESPITDIVRMEEIYEAIGDFRSSQFIREVEMKVLINGLDEQGLINFDIDQAW